MGYTELTRVNYETQGIGMHRTKSKLSTRANKRPPADVQNAQEQVKAKSDDEVTEI